MPNPVCAKCNDTVTKVVRPGLQCGGSCERFFHGLCAKITDAEIDRIGSGNISWFCVDCRSQRRKSVVVPRSPDNSTQGKTGTEFVVPNAENFSSEGQSVRELLIKLISLQKSQSEQVEIIKKQNDIILQENKNLKHRIVELESKNSTYLHKIQVLEAELDQPKQEDVSRKIIIAGVCNSTNKPDNIVKKVATYLGITIEDSDIVSVKVLGAQNSASASKEGSKSVVSVEFRDQAKKKEFISRKRGKTPITTDHLEIAGELSEVFIREQLTPFKLHLFRQVRKFRRDLNLRFAWVKEGRILLRKEPKSKVFEVHSEVDLQRIQKLFTNQIHRESANI